MSQNLGHECPIARALDVVGEKWSLLILRDLFRKGPQRFVDLQRSVIGIAPNTLSARLKSLETHNIVASRLYEKHPPRPEYYLTEKGRELGPILKALHDWGEKHSGGTDRPGDRITSNPQPRAAERPEP